MQKGFLFTGLVILGIAILVSYLNEGTAGYATLLPTEKNDYNPQRLFLEQEHTVGKIRLGVRCHWNQGMRQFICRDKEGNEVPFQCGQEFYAPGSDWDTHSLNGVCDVMDVHIPNALAQARNDAAPACATLLHCFVFEETSFFASGTCSVRNPKPPAEPYLYTAAMANVYGRCVAPSTG